MDFFLPERRLRSWASSSHSQGQPASCPIANDPGEKQRHSADQWPRLSVPRAQAPPPRPAAGSGRGLARCSVSRSGCALGLEPRRLPGGKYNILAVVFRACPETQMFGVHSPQTWVIESDTFFTGCRLSCPVEALLYSLLLSRLQCTLSSESSNVLAARSSILMLGKAHEFPQPPEAGGRPI